MLFMSPMPLRLLKNSTFYWTDRYHFMSKTQPILTSLLNKKKHASVSTTVPVFDPKSFSLKEIINLAIMRVSQSSFGFNKHVSPRLYLVLMYQGIPNLSARIHY